ncbi:MAG: hypothetical protein EA351_11755 [Gemmatimonadales bacterium]|nr:MAG: hypothetical protein EA351_11755 [Gemmatimonadales bacterium]
MERARARSPTLAPGVEPLSEALENEIRTLRAHFWSERDPEGRAFAPLADAYLRKGDLDEAHALLEDGLGRIPDFTSGHLIAARVHRARGDDEAFRTSVERLLEIDKDNAAGLRLLGELREVEGRPREALDAFRRALAANPEYDDLESRITRLEMDAPAESTRHSETDESDRAGGEAGSEFESDSVPEVERDGVDELEAERAHPAIEDDAFQLDDFGAVELSEEDDHSQGDPFDLAWEEPPVPEEGPAEEDPFDEEAFSADDPSPPDPDVSTEPELSPEATLESERGSPVPEAAGWSPGTGSSALADADREIVLEGEPAGELPLPASDRPEFDPPDSEDSKDSEATGAGPREDSPTVTRTLGELYFRQGLSMRAIEIYEDLVRRSPDDDALKERLQEIRGEIDLPVEDHAASGVDVEATEALGLAEATAGTGESTTEEGLELEERAPQWTDEADEELSLEVSTPFAWSRAEHPEDEEPVDETPAPATGRSIADYLGDLRAWEPGAIPIEALDPETVPIESLAPGGASGHLDPEAPGSASRNPDDQDGAEDGEGGLDDFQDWLRGLRS